MLYPSYLNLSDKEFQKRIERLFEILKNCEICPRKCHINRLKDETGYCKLKALPVVSSFNPHFGEEKILVGEGGSGTIFFTSCNLGCVYCQNYEISQLRIGNEISYEKLAEIMIYLQELGCHNINLVTPTPQVPAILKAIFLARQKGLILPIIYNTNAYDSVEVLKLLDGIVDIYMPDFKYSDDEIAQKYSNAPGYFEIAKKVIKHPSKIAIAVNKDETEKINLITLEWFMRTSIKPPIFAVSIGHSRYSYRCFQNFRYFFYFSISRQSQLSFPSKLFYKGVF